MQVVLQTERVVLRRFTEADVDNLVELDGDPAVVAREPQDQERPRIEQNPAGAGLLA